MVLKIKQRVFALVVAVAVDHAGVLYRVTAKYIQVMQTYKGHGILSFALNKSKEETYTKKLSIAA